MQAIPPLKPKAERTKRKIDREAIEDQKFRDDLDARAYESRIEREANDQISCKRCGSSDWRVQHKHHLVNLIANEVIVTMTCRKCKQKEPFATKLDPTEDED